MSDTERAALLERLRASDRAGQEQHFGLATLLIDDLRAAIALIERGEAQTGWQPIETAPKKTNVMLANTLSGYVARGRRDPAAWHGRLVIGGRWAPTHWMPLPPAPRPGEREA